MRQIDELFNLDMTKPEEISQTKAESYAMPAKFITKDDTADQDMALKVQVLVDKLKEYKEKLMNLRNQNLETVKASVEKSVQIERLTVKIEALEKEVQEKEFISNVQGTGHGGVYRLKDGKSNEKSLKMRQERRQELMMGIDLVGGNDLNELTGRQLAEKNCFTKIIDSISNLMAKMMILTGDYKRIESRYDKSIAAYFGFYRFLVNLSILVLVIYLYLLISHFFIFDGSLSDTCSGTLCFTLYYAFDQDEGTPYVVSLVVLIIATVVTSITKWVRADKLKTRSEIFGGNEAKVKKISAIVFNSWSWSINTELESVDQSVNIYNMIHNALSDNVRQRQAANRTASQKSALLIKRIIGNIIFVAILIAGWVIIILLSLSEQNIADNFEDSSQGLRVFMRFLPKFGVSFVNAMFPALTVKITALESWDTTSFILRVQIIRIYVTKVLNIVLYALLNLELATGSSWFLSSDGRIPFQDSSFNCREDQAGLNLATLVITETITGKLIPLGFVLINMIVAKVKKLPSWKKEIKVAQQVINIIYFQGLLWICIPFFPYVILLAPIFLFLDFKFQSWRLGSLQAKPLEQTQSYDILILIMRLFNITVLMILAYFGYFLTVDMEHGTYSSGKLCGPFPSKASANSVIINDIEDTLVIGEIWTYFLNYSPVFWVLIIILITQILFKSNRLKLLQEYLEEKEYETDQTIYDLQKKNENLEKQNKLRSNLEIENIN